MALDVLSILTLIGITVVVGYVGSFIFDKTKVPDIIWLILFGVIAANFGFVDRALFISVTPLLAALALLIILFDAGLNMEFYTLVRGFSRSLLLAVVVAVFDITVVSILSIVLLKFTLLEGLLLGAILGGTSSPIVISMVNRLKVSDKVKTLLNLESIITDPLVIVLAIAMLNLIAFPNAQYSALNNIVSAFSIGAVIGFMTGIVWLIVLDRLKGKQFDYMLTLAALFLVYVFVESVSGSGAIAALIFGLVLGNGITFSKILKLRKRFSIDVTLRSFQSEVSFFMRSFFFVYIGVIVLIHPDFLIYGAVISLILIIIRIVAADISTFRMSITKYEKNIIRTMAPRGLASAVLAQLPLTYGLANAQIFTNIVFIVIIATVVYTAIMNIILTEKAKREEESYIVEKIKEETKKSEKGKKTAEKEEPTEKSKRKKRRKRKRKKTAE